MCYFPTLGVIHFIGNKCFEDANLFCTPLWSFFTSKKMAPTTNARKSVTASWRGDQRTVNTATWALASVFFSSCLRIKVFLVWLAVWKSKLDRGGKYRRGEEENILSCEMGKTHQVDWKWQSMTRKYHHWSSIVFSSELKGLLKRWKQRMNSWFVSNLLST